ncbi:MAG: hypothetical protein KF836_10585 [Fimbriimonadaceae bacterium]|nr:hypothetical protein [Fimbriimonadaceae bacterium]
MISSLLLTTVLIEKNFAMHEFVFTYEGAKSVSVAGTFNNWNKDADPMIVDADRKTWRLTKNLGIGTYQYKFVVNSESWFIDPQAKESLDDGNGHTNSILRVVPEDYKNPAKIGDGIIAKSTLLHRLQSPDLVIDGNIARLLLRVRPNDVQSVSVVLDSGKSVPMTRVAGNQITDTYLAQFAIDPKQAFNYEFKLKDGQATHTYSPLAGKKLSPATYQEFQLPGWAEKSVFYQIFPDRFANGNKSNDPADVTPWDSNPTYSNFTGGDLAGVSKNISYLKRLGITGIYFNPVFTSPSNHGYETTDYLTIEPRLGTNAEFMQLTSDLKKAGIRTVLDGVFNHTSIDFQQFADIRRNGKNSKFLDWFFIKSFPVVRQPNPPYEAWAGYESMPKLNILNPETTSFILKTSDYWVNKVGIAGWRLDVANEVPMDFWRKFRTHIKSQNPDTWILGENWSDSSQWLQGDQWDSAMNYPFRGAVLEHIAYGKSNAQEFLDQLMDAYLLYGPQVSRNMLNSLGTHDTPRFLNQCREDTALARMGAVALFAWPGVPCVYYGDELGMTGGIDPDNRRGMRWDLNTEKNEFKSLYQKLISVRKNCQALQSGDPLPLLAENRIQVSVFARTGQKDFAIAAFNRSDDIQEVELDLKQLKAPTSTPLVDVVSGKALSFSGDTRLRLRLPAKSAALVVPQACFEPALVQRNQSTLVIQ